MSPKQIIDKIVADSEIKRIFEGSEGDYFIEYLIMRFCESLKEELLNTYTRYTKGE